jgi:hypothetical protein
LCGQAPLHPAAAPASSADALEAKAALLCDPKYRVCSNRDDAKLLAASKMMQARRQSAVQLQQKLEFLLLHGWQTQGLPSRVMQKNLQWLLWRVLFAEKHKCVSDKETSLATATVLTGAEHCA